MKPTLQAGASAKTAAAAPKRTPRALPQALLICLFASAASLASFFWYYSRGDTLLYGDAVAHLNIARRIFDSLTPGFRQLGTVWLPLPHALIAPFVVNDWMWHSGVGGSIVSMLAYVAATLGIFRLVRSALSKPHIRQQLAIGGAWLAALAFALNPNLLYLQTTAMTEPLYLALSVWALIWLQDFVNGIRSNDMQPGRALVLSGVCLCAGEMTRYDGWFAAGFFTVSAAAIWIARHRSRPMLRPFVLFLVIVAAAPVFWFGYNWSLSGNPLDFATGPYSARAIELQSAHGAGPLHPGDHDLKLAAYYFVRTTAANLGQIRIRYLLLLLAAAGTVVTIRVSRAWLLLLLWVPLPFYIYSIAYGHVPIFMPELFPWSYYNVRYGTALLPAVVVGCAVLAGIVASRFRQRLARAATFAVMGIFFAATYASAYFIPHHRGWSFPGEPAAGPITWREAKVNAVTRIALEEQLARVLTSIPRDSTVLMYCGAHVGALQRAEFPLRQVINESNWRRWNSALLAPAYMTNYVVAMVGDPVAQAVALHPEHLTPITVIDTPGQPRTTVYLSEVHFTR